MNPIKMLTTALLCLALFCAAAFSQGVSNYKIAGQAVASEWGKWQISSISALTPGSTSFPPSVCQVTAGTGFNFIPFNTATSATVKVVDANSANTETVTVTSFTYSGSQCSPVLNTANTHNSFYLTSGTCGLAEALLFGVPTGGVVIVDQDWYNLGCTQSTITGMLTTLVLPNVMIIDNHAGTVYYSAQPSTLTALATPATRSATAGNTQVISGTAVGTWAASAYFVCVTYVDILGGESPCSASFSFTATASVALNFASPAASTGAVGWRAYAGLTGTSTQYQLPISSSTCTLSTLVVLYPTCAIGSAGVFPTPSTTTMLAPGQVTAVYRPNTISHTTFAYAPSGVPPIFYGSTASTFQSFATHEGPFVATVGGTTTQVQVLGTKALPIGFLNTIGRTIKVSGHITMTAGTSETPVLRIQLGPTWTTGTPTDICIFKNTTALSAAVYALSFTCYIETQATGTSGTVQPDGLAVVALGAGTTAGTSMPELSTAAITTNLVGITGAGGNVLFVTYIPTSGTDTAVQLLDLHIEPWQ